MLVAVLCSCAGRRGGHHACGSRVLRECLVLMEGLSFLT